KDFEKAFEKVDIILSPVTPNPAFTIAAHSNDPVAMYLEDMFAIPQVMAGIPAISVPCGVSKEGLPIGLQLMGPQFEEARLLRVGHVWEQMEEI
ncbi:MAG TPA: amidase family protein, partial [Candidatus Nanoarchaeia archaeon]|nr:amidase family protein [Candidatus Nanoarchaeia archaeon]